MTRTLLCSTCTTFVDVTDGMTWAQAMTVHVLDSTTHHTPEVSCYALDGLFEAIMEHNRPWPRALR